MNRYRPRSLYRALQVLLLCLTLSACGAERNPSASHREWKLVTSWPKNFPGIGVGVENFVRQVEQNSGGRLRIKLYAAGELVPALEVFDAVSRGVAEIGHSAAYYEKGKLPAAQFFTTMPFGMTPQEMNTWLHQGEGSQLQNDLYGEYNMLTLPGGTTGVQMGGWFNRRIETLDDIQSLKMRIPGLAGEVFSRAGGSPVLLPAAELYTSIQTGVIDAVEWTAPYNDRALGLHEVASYYYYPGWHEPGSMLQFLVNREAYEQLPADLRAILRVSAAQINQDMLYDFSANNSMALQLLLQQGIQLLRFPDDVIESLRNVSAQTVDEMAVSDPRVAKVSASYRQFAQKMVAWNQITEQSYLALRKRLEDIPSKP